MVIELPCQATERIRRRESLAFRFCGAYCRRREPEPCSVHWNYPAHSQTRGVLRGKTSNDCAVRVLQGAAQLPPAAAEDAVESRPWLAVCGALGRAPGWKLMSVKKMLN